MSSKKPILILLVPVAVLGFALWLMFHTFAVSGSGFLISAKAWSDFGSHLALIRSFSKGANWPPQYPLYPGEPIRYHYLFFAVVGWLERIGIRLDLGLNLISALGFASLACLIFILSSRLFASIRVGLLSVIFFLLNSSFSFLDFLASHHFSGRLFGDLVSNSVFPSFGPWNGSQISAFWSLNIYTNQRHLALSFAILTLVIYILHFSRRKIYLIGFLLGSLALLNQAALLIGTVFSFWYFIKRPGMRRPLFVSALGAVPWLIISLTTQKIAPDIHFQPGYLVSGSLTIFKWLRFWVLNLGLNIFIIPIAFFLSPKNTRIFIMPLIIIFTLGNLFNFSADIINNHKLFNYFIIIGSMFTADFIDRLLSAGPVLVISAVLITLFLVLGGIIDIFPVVNDYYISVADAPVSPDVSYFLSLPPKSVVLNSFWFYHPASIAGRSIFNGYSYFTWSYGYDQVSREKQTVGIYSAPDKITACRLLRFADIDYVEISPSHESFINPNPSVWSNFDPDYISPVSGLMVYSVSDNCVFL